MFIIFKHMRYHNDAIAINFSFYDILTLNIQKNNKVNKTVLNEMKKLRNRCLDPGLYYKHLMIWLKHFTPKQIIVIDGKNLTYQPVKILNELQTFLNVDYYLDYKNLLKYNKRKGFFCVKTSSVVKCLGSSKGKKYPKLDDLSQGYLNHFYNESNKKFHTLLKRLSKTSNLTLI
jgi:heparan sulfate N-deacetylase/N-sulfotransferase NDST2